MPKDLLEGRQPRDLLAERQAAMMQDANGLNGLASGNPYQSPGESGGIGQSLLGSAASIGLGGLQGGINSGVSIANLIPGVNIPHADLSQYRPEGAVNTGLFYAGDFGAQGLLGGKAAQFLGALQKAGNIAQKGWPAFLSAIARPAAAGYGVGENAEGGGRGLSALIGGGLGTVNALTGTSAKAVAKGAETKAAGSDMYKDALGEFGDTVAKRVPKLDLKMINKFYPKGYRDSVDAFVSSPTVNNAHRAQSQFGKWLNKVSTRGEDGVRVAKSGVSQRAVDAADDAQKRIRGTMFETLSEASPDAWGKYAAATENWRDLSKVYDSPAFKKIFKEAATSTANKAFNKAHPEALIAKTIKNAVKSPYTKGAAGLLGITYGGKEIIKSLKGDD